MLKYFAFTAEYWLNCWMPKEGKKANLDASYVKIVPSNRIEF